MKKVKIGIIGCGGRILSVFENLKKATDQVEVITLSDPNPPAPSVRRRRPAIRQPECMRIIGNWCAIPQWNG